MNYCILKLEQERECSIIEGNQIKLERMITIFTEIGHNAKGHLAGIFVSKSFVEIIITE